jgi:hypothetical protein
MPQIADIQIQLCYPSPHARRVDKNSVNALSESISEVGLLNPISVIRARRASASAPASYQVLAGMHRLAAVKLLKWRSIPAIILNSVDDLHAQLILLDENLYRNDLTAAERSIAQARRKAIYLQLHPETKRGAAGGEATKAKTTGEAVGQDGQQPVARFDEAASKVTGQSERSVRRDVARGEALGETALKKIARTSLDSGAEMDALIQLPEGVRQALVEQAADGKEVSAQAHVQILVAAGIESALKVKRSDSGAPAAHMAGRVHPADDLDFSPTPPFATRALVERVLRHAGRESHCKFQTAWEPACGEGHVAEPLREYFRKVVATDIHDYGYADHLGDFLDPRNVLVPAADWIITNPPFEDRVVKFMKRALELAGTGVAMFLQLRYLEGIGRFEQIYRDHPPTIVAPFVERVPLLMGKYDPDASTTTAFMWLVWLKGARASTTFWIPPGCKQALTKPDDRYRFTQKPVEKRDVSVRPEPAPAPVTNTVPDDYPELPECLRRAT